jgi:hypothetical protein
MRRSVVDRRILVPVALGLRPRRRGLSAAGLGRKFFREALLATSPVLV